MLGKEQVASSSPPWECRDTHPMFIEPTITRFFLGYFGYIWLDTKIVFEKYKKPIFTIVFLFLLTLSTRSSDSSVLSIIMSEHL